MTAEELQALGFYPIAAPDAQTEKTSVRRNHAVTNFVVFRPRDDAACYQIIGVVVGARGNDPVGFMFGHSRQV